VGDRPALSKGEMEIVRAVWDLGEASVRQVHERLAESRAVEFATVQTFLRRLEAKGYLRGDNRGKVRFYSPRAKKQSVIRATVDEFVDRMFGGSALPLVRCLVEDGRVSADEVAELRTLLDRLDAERKEAGDE
jgi:BlaI family transcriptional regulator, penicillinase repressor